MSAAAVVLALTLATEALLYSLHRRRANGR